MSILVNHIIRDPYFTISEDDIIIIDDVGAFIEYRVNIYVDAQKMFDDDVLEIVASISSSPPPPLGEISYPDNKLLIDVTKAFPNTLDFSSPDHEILYTDETVKLTNVDLLDVSTKLKLALKNNIDPIQKALTKTPYGAFNKNTGNLLLNNNDDFIYAISQGNTTQVKVGTSRLKKLTATFKIQAAKSTESLYFIFSETGKNGMPKSYFNLKINCEQKMIDFKSPKTKPTISGSEMPSGHILNIFHPDKRIKKLRLFSKKLLNADNNNFQYVGEYNVENSPVTTLKIPAAFPTIYRVQGHGYSVQNKDSKFSSCIVGDFNSSNRKLSPTIVASQENNYVNIKFFFGSIDIASAELWRTDMTSKVDEKISPDVLGFEYYNDESVLHRQKYSYYLKYFTKHGLSYTSQKSSIVNFIYPSLKFDMEMSTTIEENGNVIIELQPKSEESDASLFYSSFFNDSPNLKESDLNSLINNYDYVLLTSTERIDMSTGNIKSLGFSGDIADDGKITINDNIEKSGDYSYISKLFARPIKQIIADIKATAKFNFQNKGKFSDMISDAVTSQDTDLNFDEKFLNQYSIFDSTLVYGRSMAEKFEKILEHGKTGVVRSSKISFNKTQNIRIFNTSIIEKQKRPVISFSIAGPPKIDSILIKIQTMDSIYFIDSLLPAGNLSYMDNVTRKGTGKVHYSVVPIMSDLTAHSEVFIGSFLFDSESDIIDEIKQNSPQGVI